MNKSFREYSEKETNDRFLFMKWYSFLFVVSMMIGFVMVCGQVFGMIFLDYNFFASDILHLPIIGPILIAYFFAMFFILVVLIFLSM